MVAGISTGFTAKFSSRVLVGFSLLAIAAGLVLVGPASSWTALLPSMFVTGAGMGLFNRLRASLSIAVAEPAKSGMSSGMSETFYQVGTTVGIAARGAFFQAQVSHMFSFVSGLGDMMTTAAVVAFIGAIAAFGFIRKRDLHESAI